MTPVFPAEAIRAMILAAVLCSLLPLVFLGYYRAKTGTKFMPFFIGMGCYFAFSYLGGSLLNLICLSVFRLGQVLAGHPVYLSVYYAVSSGVCGVLGLYIGLKYAMKNRPGKQNAFLFGLGAGGLECILYGGIVNITSLVLALLVNGLGLDSYLAKMQIPAAEIENQKQLIMGRAAISPAAIYNDASGCGRHPYNRISAHFSLSGRYLYQRYHSDCHYVRLYFCHPPLGLSAVSGGLTGIIVPEHNGRQRRQIHFQLIAFHRFSTLNCSFYFLGGYRLFVQPSLAAEFFIVRNRRKV